MPGTSATEDMTGHLPTGVYPIPLAFGPHARRPILQQRHHPLRLKQPRQVDRLAAALRAVHELRPNLPRVQSGQSCDMMGGPVDPLVRPGDLHRVGVERLQWHTHRHRLQIAGVYPTRDGLFRVGAAVDARVKFEVVRPIEDLHHQQSPGDPEHQHAHGRKKQTHPTSSQRVRDCLRLAGVRSPVCHQLISVLSPHMSLDLRRGDLSAVRMKRHARPDCKLPQHNLTAFAV